MMYGEEFMTKAMAKFNGALSSFSALTTIPIEQIEAAVDRQTAEEEAQFQKLMAESKLRQIEMYRSMKEKYPNSAAVQQLCDEQLARLEAETTTGA